MEVVMLLETRDMQILGIFVKDRVDRGEVKIQYFPTQMMLGNYFTWKLGHINISYFFVKDRVDKGEVIIDYFPTQMMLADHFTKPLKGKVLKIYMDLIMGYKPTS